MWCNFQIKQYNYVDADTTHVDTNIMEIVLKSVHIKSAFCVCPIYYEHYIRSSVGGASDRKLESPGFDSPHGHTVLYFLG